MSFIPQDVLNLKYAQILLGSGTYSIAANTTGQILTLSSVVKNTNSISVSGNDITLSPGPDYFIVSSIHYTTSLLSYPSAANVACLRLGIYESSAAVPQFITQKTTWPYSNSVSNITTPWGGHTPQLYCVIPAFAQDKTCQLRVQATVGSATTLYIRQNSAEQSAPDSTLMIYHN